MLEVIQDGFQQLLEMAHPAEEFAARIKGIYPTDLCEACVSAYSQVREGEYDKGLHAWNLIHDTLANLDAEEEDLGYVDSLRALCLSRLGHGREAQVAAARSVLLAPHLAETHLILATMYLEFDNSENALQEFTRAREIERRKLETRS